MALMSEYFFLENVLLLINCLLFILEGWCQSESKKRLVSHLLRRKDGLAVLATGFGKSLIYVYQSFVLVKEMDESSVVFSSGRPCCLVIQIVFNCVTT